MDAADWNARYDTSELIWKGEPNQFLPPEVEGLAPGRAVDLACGEGRNAVWLATRGWDVTGVDFAGVGLAKAEQLAAEKGVTGTWITADATSWDPPHTYDLVIVFYLQLVDAELVATLRHVAAVTAAGGTVLVVGHHVDNLDRGYGGPTSRAVLHDPQRISELLGEWGLDIVRAEMVERLVDTADGERIALDSLVRAQAADGRRTIGAR
jgi:SAM-dependent methyltransferase